MACSSVGFHENQWVNLTSVPPKAGNLPLIPSKKKKKRLLPHPACCLWTMVGVFLQDLALGKIPCPLNHCRVWALWSWSWATVRFFNLCEHSVASVVSDSLQPYGLWPARLLCSWNFPGKNTGVSCHSLLQDISLTQGSNPGSYIGRHILYSLSHQGSPILQYIHCNFKWMKYENGDC